MRKILKRITSVACVCLLASSAMLTNVYADNAAGAAVTIGLNSTKAEEAQDFKELLLVNDGTTYLPIRLAFPHFGSKEYEVIISPNIDESNVRIKVYKRGENGKMQPQRKVAFIGWLGDIDENGKVNGRVETISYESDNVDNDNYYKDTTPDMHNTDITRNELKCPLIFKNVDNLGGQRLFVSLDDLKDLVDFLIGDNDYTVEIFKPQGKEK